MMDQNKCTACQGMMKEDTMDKTMMKCEGCGMMSKVEGKKCEGEKCEGKKCEGKKCEGKM